MKSSDFQIIELAVSKAKTDPKFSKDLVNYFKYIILESCPEARLNELNSIFKHGDLKDLFDFAKEVIPGCSEMIANYVKAYK